MQEDLYYPHPLVQDILWGSLHKFLEPILMHWPGKKLREKAITSTMEHIHYEDENTRYICIGPVNKVIVERSQAARASLQNVDCSLNFQLLVGAWEYWHSNKLFVVFFCWDDHLCPLPQFIFIAFPSILHL